METPVDIKNVGPFNGPSITVTVQTASGTQSYNVAGGDTKRVKLAAGDAVTNVSVN